MSSPLIIVLDETVNDTNSGTKQPLDTSYSQELDPFHSDSSTYSEAEGEANMQNAAVSIQKIAFWSANPGAWFRVIETQFTVARISDEVTKFNHIISMLDPDTINKCMDILEDVSADTPYSDFRTRVIARLSESEQSRLNKVLLGTDLGDRKPSELLSLMQSLAKGSFKEEALKTLWLQRLPSQVRAILAVSSEELPQLALLGDKVMETMNQQSVASATAVPHTSMTAVPHTHIPSRTTNCTIVEKIRRFTK